MIYAKDHKQTELFTPWDGMGPKRRKKLEASWAGLFRAKILEDLPIKKFGKFFSIDQGRPTKDLYTLLGVAIFQEMFDLTDEAAVDQLAYNVKWQYALNITDESDDSAYISPRTLWGVRQKMVEAAFHDELFNTVIVRLAELFNVDHDKQRLDSVHIKSNMKHLSRLALFTSVLKKFLTNLKRGYEEAFNLVEAGLAAKYLPEKESGYFGQAKPSERQRLLEETAQDLYGLVRRFKDDEAVCAMHSFKLMERVLTEQCQIHPDDDSEPLKLKEPKDIPSGSLQNVSDEDAAYSGHKGQGFQAQIMETYTETEDTEEKAGLLNLITHAEVEKANQSDAQALEPAIEDVENKGLKPGRILADTGYGSDENVGLALEAGIELVSPVAGKDTETEFKLANFQTDERGVIKSCPQGQEPLETKMTSNKVKVSFDLEHCQSCPHQSQCPVKLGHERAELKYTQAQLRLSKRRQEMKTDAFKNKYCWRSGIEATNSQLDRLTGLKHLRVRGLAAVSYRVVLRALGVNILRAAAVMAAILAKSGPSGGSISLVSTFFGIYYAILAIVSLIGKFLRDQFQQTQILKAKRTFR
jgi:hypothetical protein